MQRFPAFLSFLLAILYGGIPAFSTAAENQDAPHPHLALLLPLSSPAFARYAEAVRAGFLAAAQTHGAGDLPVSVYATGDAAEESLAAYQKALAAGARIVVGPLTRSGVSALAASELVSAPTLALNMPEAETAVPRELFFFGLQADAEARQAAQLAAAQGKSAVFAIGDETPLARRLQQAFLDEWQKLGGAAAGQAGYGAEQGELRQNIAASGADAIFLALDSAKARLLLPYLDSSIAVYATSQVFLGNADTLGNFDLNGVRFVDMPWLLQPDHPAVMIYPRPENPAAEYQRLYALGIDAFRLAQELLRGGDELNLDGVTGRIRLHAGHQFVRTPVPAWFRQGEATVLYEPQF